MAQERFFTVDEKRVIRDAMLKARSVWLDEAELGESLTQRSIARVIADVFLQEADKYKTKETFSDNGSVISTGSTGSAWDDEHGTASSLPEAGEADGGPRDGA